MTLSARFECHRSHGFKADAPPYRQLETLALVLCTAQGLFHRSVLLWEAGGVPLLKTKLPVGHKTCALSCVEQGWDILGGRW